MSPSKSKTVARKAQENLDYFNNNYRTQITTDDVSNSSAFNKKRFVSSQHLQKQKQKPKKNKNKNKNKNNNNNNKHLIIYWKNLLLLLEIIIIIPPKEMIIEEIIIQEVYLTHDDHQSP